MGKIDKSQYTKKQWNLIKEHRRKQKQESRAYKEAKRTKQIVQSQKEKIKKSQIVTSNGIAFVLGNGVSRRDIELEPLKDLGKVYACNAVYRNFNPDYLIAVDSKMIIEINKSGYQHTNTVWTNPNKAYSKFKNFNYFNPSKGWSSGPTALWLASQHKYDTIYIVGFDYRGNENGKYFNNIYADTFNYKKSSEGATFFGNWLRQTKSVIDENKDINYIRVIADNGYIPPDLQKCSNLEHISVSQFRQIFEFF